MKLKGVCVSPGKVKGRLKAFAPGATVSPEEIILLEEHRTQHVIQLAEAGGIISKDGAITSHASVIARELGIPCLVSVARFDTLKEGTIVELDATNGEVKTL